MKLIQPTYYVRHPDDTYSVADPQPVASEPSSGERDWRELAKSAGFQVMRGKGLLPNVPEDVFIGHVYITKELEAFAALLSSDAKPASYPTGISNPEHDMTLAYMAGLEAASTSQAKVFIDHGSVKFSIGHQTFTLYVDYPDEPGRLEWYADMLRKSLMQKASEPVAVPQGFVLVRHPVTEEMHIAAVKVLQRAHGLDGLPQRMLDAMLSAAPSPAPVGIKKEND